jgi:hypothetical protein
MTLIAQALGIGLQKSLSKFLALDDRCRVMSASPESGPEVGGRTRVQPGRTPCDSSSQTGELRIMRYELTDHEWAAIKPMLPNKPRSVARVNDRRVLNGIFWVLQSS